MKCKICGIPIQWNEKMNVPQNTLCPYCWKDCDCAGLEKL